MDPRRRVGRLLLVGVVVAAIERRADRSRETIDFRVGQDIPEHVIAVIFEFFLHCLACQYLRVS